MTTSSGKRVLVCGGRDFTDRQDAFRVLDTFESPALVIVGGARGADMIAAEWAKMRGYARVIFPANWTGELKAAGYRRNVRMLEIGQPDLVIAFPGGKGTANMVSLARRAGISVVEV